MDTIQPFCCLPECASGTESAGRCQPRHTNLPLQTLRVRPRQTRINWPGVRSLFPTSHAHPQSIAPSSKHSAIDRIDTQPFAGLPPATHRPESINAFTDFFRGLHLHQSMSFLG